MTVTVITAAYGGDRLQDQPEQSIACRWLAVTDHANHPADALRRWETKFEPRPHLSPRMAAKIPKYLPSQYIDEGDLAVWMDCSVRLTSPHAISRFATMAMEFNGLYMLPHPDRGTVQDEWPHAAAQGRYAGQMIKEQVEFYQERPMFWVDESLWATTIIAQRISPENHVMGLGWLVQNCIWSAQDQISLPWIAANSYVHIWPITLDLWHNEYFTLRQRERDE